MDAVRLSDSVTLGETLREISEGGALGSILGGDVSHRFSLQEGQWKSSRFSGTGYAGRQDA